MTKIMMTQREDKGYAAMELQGHCGFDRLGRDILCAAVSMLAYTAGQIVEQMYAAGKLRRKPTLEFAPGRVLIQAEAYEAHYRELLYTLYVAQIGYGMLAKAYPAYVELIPFGK